MPLPFFVLDPVIHLRCKCSISVHRDNVGSRQTIQQSIIAPVSQYDLLWYWGIDTPWLNYRQRHTRAKVLIQWLIVMWVRRHWEWDLFICFFCPVYDDVRAVLFTSCLTFKEKHSSTIDKSWNDWSVNQLVDWQRTKDFWQWIKYLT